MLEKRVFFDCENNRTRSDNKDESNTKDEKAKESQEA